jgi:hypothetical protein
MKLASWLQPSGPVASRAQVLVDGVVAVVGAGLHQPDHQVAHAREDPVAGQGTW